MSVESLCAGPVKKIMERKDSIFSGLTPSAGPVRQQPPPSAPASAPAPAPAKPEKDPRVDGLQAAVKVLQAEIAFLKQAAARSQPAASKADIEAVKLNISDTLSSFEDIRRKLSGYAGEFSGIETECRKSLGEMRSCAKDIDVKLAAAGFGGHLKDLVSRLSAKVADIEKALHAGLSDLSNRLMTSRKIFSEAEEKLHESLEPRILEADGRLKELASKVTWLTDEYSIVMERKMRALEVKYSAFEVISARMDAISEALKVAGGEKRET